VHEAVTVENPETLPEQGAAECFAALGGEFADRDDETPAAIPAGCAGRVDVPRGFFEATLAGRGEQVIGAPAGRFGTQPFLLGEAEYRGTHQALVKLQRLQQADQAAQPDTAAARQNRVTKYRNDEGACLYAALLAEVVETFLDRGQHWICRVSEAEKRNSLAARPGSG
jgi:hypothetical protein